MAQASSEVASTHCIGSHFADLLQYLEWRAGSDEFFEEPKLSGELASELLFRARQARRRFLVVSSHTLHLARLASETGEFSAAMKALLTRLRQPRPPTFKHLIGQLADNPEVKRHIANAGASEDLVKRTLDAIGSHDVQFKKATNAIAIAFAAARGRELRLLDDTRRPKPSLKNPFVSDLLSDIIDSWARHGRGFATIVPKSALPPSNTRGSQPLSIGFRTAVASAAVGAMREFDRDIRELEDRGPAGFLHGNDAGVTIGVIVILAGMLLLAIGRKVEDPTLRDILTAVGAVLLIIGLVIVGDSSSAVPVGCCYIDPDTGTRVCVC